MCQTEKELQDFIYRQFPAVKNERDLLLFLNDVYFFRHKSYLKKADKPMLPIQMAAFRYYKYPELSENRYSVFTIKKRSGKLRTIHAPANGLKIILQCLNDVFQAYYQPTANVCGFIPHRNITDGARQHINKRFVFKIDLQNFFDSIAFHRVKSVLLHPPFNLNGEREGLANTIASLCCHPKKVAMTDRDGNTTEVLLNVLPQGAPTSPILSNWVCAELDSQLERLAMRFKATYTRYADDITFSSDRNIFRNHSEFIQAMTRIIESEQHLRINHNKTRLRNRYHRQEVTGIVVNKRVNVSKRYVSQLRLWLHYWEKFGKKRAQRYFLEQYLRTRGNVKSKEAKIENVIKGKLDFMRMVVGEENHSYQQLQARFDTLVRSSKTNKRRKRYYIIF
jgi:hypothetical protein